MNGLLAALAGANVINGLGALEFGLTFDYAKFMLDVDCARMIRAVLAGIPLTDEQLALDVIARVGPGGQYLGQKHTSQHMRERTQARLFDRQSRHGWSEQALPISWSARASKPVRLWLPTSRRRSRTRLAPRSRKSSPDSSPDRREPRARFAGRGPRVATDTSPSDPERSHKEPLMLSQKAIKTLDRRHIIHSWSVQADIRPPVLERGEGVYFWDGDGNRYLDFSSGLVNLSIGHQHPTVVQAIKDEAETLLRACGLGLRVAVQAWPGPRRGHAG